MADTSRDMHDDSKNFAGSIFQQGKYVVDADINDARRIMYGLFRSYIQNLVGTGFVGDAFKVLAFTPNATNNFMVSAGFGWVDGNRVYAPLYATHEIIFNTQAEKNTTSRISSITSLTLTDLRMNWTVNELADRTLVVVTGAGTQLKYLISSNTSTTITIASGDMVADGVIELDMYSVKSSTPQTGDRTDLVYLNTFLDEVTEDEDDSLNHSIGGGYVSEIRRVTRSVISVKQGVTYATDIPADYVDALGNAHVLEPLCLIARTSGVDDIVTADLTDARNVLYSKEDYLLLAGGTMTGDILMGNNIIQGGSNIRLNFETGIFNGIAELLTDALTLAGSSTTIPIGPMETSSTADFSASGEVEYDPDYVGNLSTPIRVRFRGDRFGTARLVTAKPIDGDDCSTKGYVDQKVDSHRHTEYLSAGDVWAKTTLDDLGIGTFEVGDRIAWSHGLAESFPIVHIQMYITSATSPFYGMWINAEGEISWGVQDSDTILIIHQGSLPIVGSSIRIVAMRTSNDIVINDFDIIQSGALMEPHTVALT